MLKSIITIILIFAINQAAMSIAVSYIYEKKYHLVVKSRYKKNRKVWGAFKLTQKHYQLKTAGKIFKAKVIPTAESILFKNRNIFLVKSVLNDRRQSTLKVKSFPFEIKNNSIIVDLLENQIPMKELFLKQIDEILNSKQYFGAFPATLKDREKELRFKKMKCIKKNSIIDCTYHIEVNFPLDSKTIHM